MEQINLITLCIVIAAVLGIGLGAMTWAYLGKGSISVLFQEPISSLPQLPATDAGSKAGVYFQQGIDAYKLGNYRQAAEQFNQAIELVSNLAEAYHNRGLAFANLRSDDDAVTNLLKASELYQEQNHGEAIALIKQNFEALKKRKMEREKR
ncbi:tetratricopeptide repeat protein [Phormidium nigroviride]